MSKKEPKINNNDKDKVNVNVNIQNDPKNNKNNKNKKRNNKKKNKKVFKKLLNSLRPYKNLKYNYQKSYPGLKRELSNYVDNVEAEYVYGLFHPDKVFTDNLTIKLPNLVPIPTTTFSFKETFSFKPNESGNFVIAWNPNYLGSSRRIVKLFPETENPENYSGFFSNIYLSNNDVIDGNSAASNFRGIVFKHINQDFSKYRLTSACLKIKYTGKVLNQAGMFAACASFMEFPRTHCITVTNDGIPASYEIPEDYPQLQRLGDFDNIRQGQWAHTANIVSDPDGITCVYVPTDVLSQAFVDNGDTITTKDIEDYIPSSLLSGRAHAWLSRNANVTYDVCGYGITYEANTSPITVECYYNFEIIVNEDQIPFFRPTVTNPSLLTSEIISKNIPGAIISKNGGITETKKHDNPSTMSKIQNALKEGYGKVEPFLPLLKLGMMLM